MKQKYNPQQGWGRQFLNGFPNEPIFQLRERIARERQIDGKKQLLIDNPHYSWIPYL